MRDAIADVAGVAVEEQDLAERGRRRRNPPAVQPADREVLVGASPASRGPPATAGTAARSSGGLGDSPVRRVPSHHKDAHHAPPRPRRPRGPAPDPRPPPRPPSTAPPARSPTSTARTGSSSTTRATTSRPRGRSPPSPPRSCRPRRGHAQPARLVARRHAAGLQRPGRRQLRMKHSGDLRDEGRRHGARQVSHPFALEPDTASGSATTATRRWTTPPPGRRTARSPSSAWSLGRRVAARERARDLGPGGGPGRRRRRPSATTSSRRPTA